MNVKVFKNQTPENITIETHNLCNRKCWFCKFGISSGQETPVFMSWELIRKIVKNLQDLDFSGRLSWYRINEPLLDKRLEEIIAFSRTELPRSFLSIVTNGDLLTENRMKRLFELGMDSIGVSIYDEQAYQKFQSSSFSPCVLIDRRPKTEKNFVESRGGNIALTNSNMAQKKNCFRPTSMMNVTANGDVVLCSADFFSDVKMGSLKHQRVEEVWQSENYKKYRMTLESHGRASLPLCSNCTYHGGKHDRDYPETKRRNSCLEGSIN